MLLLVIDWPLRDKPETVKNMNVYMNVHVDCALPYSITMNYNMLQHGVTTFTYIEVSQCY